MQVHRDTRPSRARLLLAIALPTMLTAAVLATSGHLPTTFWVYLGGGCVLAPWLLLGARPLTGGADGLAFGPRGTRRWRRAWLWLPLLFGPALLAGHLAVRPYLGSVPAYRERVAALGVDLELPLMAGVVFLILNPLVEEWWWRGQATPRCCAAFGRRAGLALATLGFGIYHLVLLAWLFPLPIAALRAVLIAAAGLVWSAVAMHQGGWRDTYLAHLAADLAMVVLFALVVLPAG
ncbi:MAG: CPBP family intramembrane glutamic endopeptidase [Candidatus Krumholzibacteriia bacterium]